MLGMEMSLRGSSSGTGGESGGGGGRERDGSAAEDGRSGGGLPSSSSSSSLSPSPGSPSPIKLARGTSFIPQDHLQVPAASCVDARPTMVRGVLNASMQYLLFEPDAKDETVRRKGNSILDFQFCVDMREIEDCCAVQDMRGRRGAGAAGRPTSSYLQLYWTGGKNNGKGGAGKGGKKKPSTGRRHWNNPSRRGSAATAVVGKAGHGQGPVANQSIFFVVNTEDVEQLVESIRCWIDTLAKVRC